MLGEKMKIGDKLKFLRKGKKMTLKELSEKSGVQIATLSRMEHDVMTGTIDAHMNICKALGIFLSDFYRELENDGKNVSFIGQKEKRETFVRPKETTVEMLAANIEDKNMKPLLIRIRKNGETQKEEYRLGAQKFIYVLEGKVRARIGKEEYLLRKGDSAYLDASLSHTFQNTAKIESVLLSVSSAPAT